LTPQDALDLERIADAWGEPTAAAAWGIVAGWLAQARSEGLRGDLALAHRLAAFVVAQANLGPLAADSKPPPDV